MAKTLNRVAEKKYIFMNQKTLAASMNVAWVVSKADGMDDKEWDVFFSEMKSYKLTEAQRDALIEEFKNMDPIEAINLLRQADEATRKEAQALTMVTIYADGSISDKEAGAYSVIANLCSFTKMTFEEAHSILCF